MLVVLAARGGVAVVGLWGEVGSVGSECGERGRRLELGTHRVSAELQTRDDVHGRGASRGGDAKEEGGSGLHGVV